uniref:Isochorismate synthase 2ic n=1 Tax=Rhizophora mucronata TaxID=61149 RepID=A0A2P2L172_RHIMU
MESQSTILHFRDYSSPGELLASLVSEDNNKFCGIEFQNLVSLSEMCRGNIRGEMGLCHVAICNESCPNFCLPYLAALLGVGISREMNGISFFQLNWKIKFTHKTDLGLELQISQSIL